MLYRNRKGAFDCAAVKINDHDAVYGTGADQVGDQPRADRLAPVSAAVLPGIAEIGNNCR